MTMHMRLDGREEGKASRLRQSLIQRVDALTTHGVESQTAVPGLSVYKLLFPNAPAASVYGPSIALLLQGRKRVIVGDYEMEYDSSRFLLTSVDLPAITQALEASGHAPYLGFMLVLDLDLVRETLGDLDVPESGQSESGRGIVTLPVTTALLSSFSRLLDLLDTPQDIPFMARLIQREIIYRLLTGDQGERLRDIALSGTQRNRTAKAVAWLKHNYTRHVRVEELADVAGMGLSTLHHRFREMTAMSPLQYQKRLRLHEARRLMLIDSFDVGSAAFRVGYDSPSQFSREYRRLFGAPPVQDIRRLKLSRPNCPAPLVEASERDE